MEAIRSYLKELKAIPLLTAREEKALATRVLRGSKPARQKLIRSNLRLVVNIAKRYGHMGLPLLDLIEEGNMGLMKAVEKYNPARGYRFSTYASWWIKQHVTRAIANQGKTVRIPVYMVELLMQYKRVSEELTHKCKRKPAIGEIAKAMRMPVRKVRQLNKIATKISSLNVPVGDEGTTELMDLIEDENVPSASDEVSSFIRHERIDGLLDRLSSREKKVISMRFGLKDGTTHTLEETAGEFGITRERVRQIETAALKKLRIMVLEQDREFKKRVVSNNVEA
ncbi:MAG: sigma-70 family RNA polymerase sigma factor [Candidatus Omnitrophica bacterium]|nr:sigma-70 family RNA polymerase sigma factor [Candidatus Omnitrophota bacterium]